MKVIATLVMNRLMINKIIVYWIGNQKKFVQISKRRVIIIKNVKITQNYVRKLKFSLLNGKIKDIIDIQINLKIHKENKVIAALDALKDSIN